MSRKFKIALFVTTFLCGYVFQSSAQDYHLWKDFFEVYEAQPASARAAAMGFAQVANGGTIAEARINPAGLNKMPQKLQTEFSYSWPTFVDPKSHTSFIGAAYRINPKLSVGLSRFNYGVKMPQFGMNVGTVGYDPDKVSETFYTGTAAYEIIDGLHAGVNLSMFTYNIATGQNSSAVTGDLGVLYEKKLAPKSKKVIDNTVRFAASYTNLNRAKVAWKGIPNAPFEEQVTMTSHLYAGASYASSIDAKSFIYGKSKLIDDASRTIDLLFQLQYISFMNMRLSEDDRVPRSQQAKKFGYNLGAEVLLLKLLAIRMGYRYEKRAGDTGPFSAQYSGSLPYKKGLTFGAGLNIPLNRLTESKVPFDLSIDYMHRNKAFKWLKENSTLKEMPNSTNINLRMNWYLK